MSSFLDGLSILGRSRRIGALAALIVVAIPLAACAGSGSRSSNPAATPTLATTLADGAAPSPGCSIQTTGTTETNATNRTDGAPVTERRTVVVDGVTRSYLVTRPPQAASDQPVPVLLSFHGFGSSAEEFSSLTRLPEKGAAAGTAVVVPEGAGATWQFTGNGSDAAFVDAMLDDLGASSCIDTHRVVASGFSAGAAFTIAYSCAHPDRIAAIVTVAVDFQLGCTKPLPILAFHGTVDPAVPYVDGGMGLSLPGVKVRGTELNLDDWAMLDGCDPTAQVDQVGTEVVRRTWTGCDSSTDVVLYSVTGGGHTWPGADPSRGVGLTTQQVDASELALAFAAAHHLG